MNQNEMISEILRLADERDALILAHNYQRDEIQELAHITGDSLALSMEAARTDKSVIVFCGVHFMAESAAILAPEKTVLLPRLDAGCPMADMITAEGLREFKSKYPGVPVVTYVNSSAAVKAESDICCTSSNAVNVVASLADKEVILAPDRNLGRYIAAQVDKTCYFCSGYSRPYLLDQRYVRLRQGKPGQTIHCGYRSRYPLPLAQGEP
jgi:quinolinate synthase